MFSKHFVGICTAANMSLDGSDAHTPSGFFNLPDEFEIHPASAPVLQQQIQVQMPNFDYVSQYLFQQAPQQFQEQPPLLVYSWHSITPREDNIGSMSASAQASSSPLSTLSETTLASALSFEQQQCVNAQIYGQLPPPRTTLRLCRQQCRRHQFRVQSCNQFPRTLNLVGRLELLLGRARRRSQRRRRTPTSLNL